LRRLIWCFNSPCPRCHQVCPRSTRRYLWLTHNPRFFLTQSKLLLLLWDM
jgi:hypothetical protein